MNIFEPNALLLFILFFVPGFVAMKVYDLLIPNETRNASSYLFDAVAYSAINFIVALPVAWLFLSHHWNLIIAIVLILLVSPASIAWAYVKLLSSRFARNHAVGLVKRPWDMVFRQKEGFWVLVHLKNGEKVRGIYSSKSAVSSYPYEEQIYLEEIVVVNENGDPASVPGSKGVIIIGSEISMIEIFEQGGGRYV